jgi:tRNA (mo5U34)-methyltransferase
MQAPGSTERLLAGVPVWYHTVEVAPGVTTPGYFDLRPVVDQLPWPELAGKRCLDVATFDGFYAFEMERRGAAEVMAIDVADHMDLDWPPDARADAPSAIRRAEWAAPGTGFKVLADLLGSAAEWRALNVYDLAPETVGRFDVVVCGSLLLHLRDPLRALEAIRSVTAGALVSCEQIELGLTLAAPRKPRYTLLGSGERCQWFNFNAAGHQRLLYAAGFETVRASRPFTVRFNAHPRPAPGLRTSARRAALRVLTGSPGDGVLHRAVLARPRV